MSQFNQQNMDKHLLRPRKLKVSFTTVIDK